MHKVLSILLLTGMLLALGLSATQPGGRFVPTVSADEGGGSE